MTTADLEFLGLLRPDAEITADEEPRKPDRAAATRRRDPRQPDPKRDAKDHGRARRRASGISGYVGPNGSGKSFVMAFDTIPTLQGQIWRCQEPTHVHMRPDYVDPLTGAVGPATTGLRRVLSTVDLLDAETGSLHPLYTRLDEDHGGWRLVLDAEHCDILFDEITGIAGSRESMGLPVAVQNILQQLRKRDVLLRWTAPSWKRADSIIRDCTNAVTLCRGYFPDNRLAKRADEPMAWVPNRVVKARTFDARDFEEFTLAKASGDKKNQPKMHAMRAKPVAWIKIPGSLAAASYDSYGAVARIASYLDGGRCADCGGRRAVPVCSCKH